MLNLGVEPMSYDDSMDIADSISQNDGSSLEKVPNWTNEELHSLIELCEAPEKDWDACARSMNRLYGDKHPPEFFNAETCATKYSRLTGESCGKLTDGDGMNWIKAFLNDAITERGDAPGLNSSTTMRFEMHRRYVRGDLTRHQVTELIGVDLCNDLMSGKVVEPGQKDRDKWLRISRIASRLSIDEWKNTENLSDLLTLLNTRPDDESRLIYPQAIEEQPKKEETAERRGAEAETKEQKIEEDTRSPLAKRIKLCDKEEAMEEAMKEVMEEVMKKMMESPVEKEFRVPSSRARSDLIRPGNPENKMTGSERSTVPTSKRVRSLGTPFSSSSASSGLRVELYKVHNSVQTHPKAEIFKYPVTEDSAPNYFNIIKSPMDLSTIKDLIRNGSISDFQQLGDHYNLMCENAMTYNPTGHWVHNYALELKTFCAKTIQKALKKEETPRRK